MKYSGSSSIVARRWKLRHSMLDIFVEIDLTSQEWCEYDLLTWHIHWVNEKYAEMTRIIWENFFHLVGGFQLYEIKTEIKIKRMMKFNISKYIFSLFWYWSQHIKALFYFSVSSPDDFSQIISQHNREYFIFHARLSSVDRRLSYEEENKLQVLKYFIFK